MSAIEHIDAKAFLAANGRPPPPASNAEGGVDAVFVYARE